MPAPYTGRCQCGKVTYELTEEPLRVLACHCTNCQAQSGGAFGLSMRVKAESLKITGELKSFQWSTDSGNVTTGCFCPDCGNRIYNIPGAAAAKGTLTLKPGTLDDTSWVRPTMMVWLKRKQDWVPIPEGMKTYDEQP